MGDIANAILQGEFCCYCGSYLEVDEIVFAQHDDKPLSIKEDCIPGFPVYCSMCKED
jgi:hypothetical protein